MVTYISAVPEAIWFEGMANAIQIPDGEQYCDCAETKVAATIRILPVSKKRERQVMRIERMNPKIIVDEERMLSGKVWWEFLVPSGYDDSERYRQLTINYFPSGLCGLKTLLRSPIKPDFDGRFDFYRLFNRCWF